MAKKMTTARAERWQSDLDKALGLVQRVASDVGTAKLTTTGANYSAVMDIGEKLVPALDSLGTLVKPTSPVTRIINGLRQAADERKRAAAERAATKGAES